MSRFAAGLRLIAAVLLGITLAGLPFLHYRLARAHRHTHGTSADASHP